MSFFVTPVLGSKIRNSQGSCGKNVATLNATLIFSAERMPGDDDATSNEEVESAELRACSIIG